MRKHLWFVIALALALLASASTWFYINRILRAQQIADAAAHNRPRGNLSDLYPRWLGARELLLRGRNPYSPEITREIQQGYYGRALDPARPDDPKDQQGFAYPAYVVFPLAPVIGLPFELVETGFRWLLIALGPVSILLWLRLLRWKPSTSTVLTLMALSVGWLPMVQGIKLQQLSLLVTGFLAAAGACLAGGWLFWAGGLVALATIKPQLVWPLVIWLLVWACFDWRSRRRFVFGFASVMLVLLAGAELVLPGWLGMFLEAVGEYHRYTHNESVLAWLSGSIVGHMLEVASCAACALCLWRLRRESFSSAAFGHSVALVLALAVLVVPMFAPYNQVLLVPAILTLGRGQETKKPILTALRLARGIAALLLIWPWIATLGLTAIYPWLTPELRGRVWPLPFYSNFLLPVFIFGSALAEIWMNHPVSLRDAAPAE